MPRLKKTTKSYAPSKREQAQEIYSCGIDVVYFIENYVKVPHPMKGLLKFELYPFQKDCLRAFQNNRYVIVNKSRQLGLSTSAAAYALWLAIFQREKNILVIATKLDVAKNFIKKVKTMLTHLPPWLVMPTLVEDNTTTITFSNGSKIKAIPTSADAGRSESLSLLLVDEAAHVEGINDLWLGLQPSLSTGGSVILISSPSGVGTLFHDIWTSAQRGENNFYPIELPWHVHPERDEKWFEKEKKALIQARGEMGVAQELLCLESNTNIITQDGCKKIKNIKIGDFVLTHRGRFRKVLNTNRRVVNKHESLYSVSTPGNRQNDIIITGNHPVLNYKFKVPKGKNCKTHFRSLYKEAKIKEEFEPLDNLDAWKHETNNTRRLIYGSLFPHLQFANLLNSENTREKNIDLAQFAVPSKIIRDNFVSYPRKKRGLQTKRFVPVDFNLGRFIGLCGAEGHIEKTRIGLAFNHLEMDTLGKFCREYLRELGCDYHDCDRDYSECYVLLSCNKFLRELVRHFIAPGDARIKHYNLEAVLNTNKSFIRGLIVGHFEGDGDHPFFHDLDNKLKVVSKSEKMLYQLRTLLSLFGHYPRIGYWNNEPSYLEIDGLTRIRNSKKRNIYTLTDQIHTKSFLERATSRSFLLPEKYFLGSFQYRKISLEKEYENIPPIVYNLEVEEDNSYIADSLIVHNCSFGASGDTFLKGEAMEKVLTSIQPPIEKRSHGRYETWIWKHPEPGHEYIIGADVARGDGEDYSAFHIIDTTAEEIVADFSGKHPPDEFAQIMMDYGREYNLALICQELNNVGVACAQKLKESGYPKLYYEKFQKNIYMAYVGNDIGPSDFPGFTVNPKIREQILAKLENNIRNGNLKLYSKRLYEELQTFIWKNNKPQAQKGKNDDLVMAIAIGSNIFEFSGKNYYNDEAQWALVRGMSVESRQMNSTTGRTSDGFFSLPGKGSHNNPAPGADEYKKQMDVHRTRNHGARGTQNYNDPAWHPFKWMFDN